MDNSRYLDCLDEDYSLFRDAAVAVDLSVPVPSCPGWTMDDLVYHVAEVYLHKVTLMRTGEWPAQWPPRSLAGEPRLALLARAHGELIAEFATRGPDAVTPTWYDPDQSVAFWFRRMAQETVMHRIDAEQAAGLLPTRVPDDLAMDGIDEVLNRFLCYFSPEGTRTCDQGGDMQGEHLATQDGTETIVVAAGHVSWTIWPSSTNEIEVTQGIHGEPQATIAAAPDPLLRWLWGRAGDEVIRVDGDPAWADYLRRMLTSTIQ
jgi:uncharacterized protein (TIGR03083 family)